MRHTIACFKEAIEWNDVASVCIDKFPWYKEGLKQVTNVKIAATDAALLLKVVAMDCHSSAEVLALNGSVHKDSCFEFFFTPMAELSTSYIHIEINCIGTVYMAYKNSQEEKRLKHRQLSSIQIETSLPKGVVKKTSAVDELWTLDIKIPFDFIEAMFGEPISRSRWFGNFYRCGGILDPQYASWNDIITVAPDFHQPLQFGELTFSYFEE